MFSSVRPRSRFQVVVSKSKFFFHKSVLMNKYKEIFGVDISKGVFDVHGSKSGYNQFKNNPSGFKPFLKSLPKESLVVMEATGYY
jgi:transposase